MQVSLSEEGRDQKMTTLRAFTCDDLFRFNNINLDPLTETYGIPFYLQYLAHWPEYFVVAEAPGGELMGYIMGKAEGSVAREEWHGHVTALSVATEFRRLGLAAKLMELLEEISERYEESPFQRYREEVDYTTTSSSET
ncbi:N-alpha-acetyltransferase 20 isoform X4 [Latimeria chalumnae]|uniref:N-alpha-acetyltransferase 20 isoform X4 n=1 Tax=Latimeria chalumnae TaxID=7897 RepID=UPI0003C14D05